MNKLTAGIAAGLLAMTVGAVATDLRDTGPNEDRWQACIAMVYENPGAGGDISYEACDARYDPHQEYTYFTQPPAGCTINDDGSATCQDDQGGWHFEHSPW